MSETDTARGVTGQDEVVDLCRELIQIDTSNYGDHSGPGERKAAEYVAEKLAEVGLEPRIFESHPGRASTVARIEGEDPSRPALLIHGHTDVVPANADDWTHHPFSGEIADPLHGTERLADQLVSDVELGALAVLGVVNLAVGAVIPVFAQQQHLRAHLCELG